MTHIAYLEKLPVTEFKEGAPVFHMDPIPCDCERDKNHMHSDSKFRKPDGS